MIAPGGLRYLRASATSYMPGSRRNRFRTVLWLTPNFGGDFVKRIHSFAIAVPISNLLFVFHLGSRLPHIRVLLLQKSKRPTDTPFGLESAERPEPEEPL